MPYTFNPFSGNFDNTPSTLKEEFIRANFLALTGGTLTGKLTVSGFNIGPSQTPLSTVIGDVWLGVGAIRYKDPLNVERVIADSNRTNIFSSPQIIDSDTLSPTLRITNRGGGYALLVEDKTNPDNTPFLIDTNGTVGIGLSSLSGIDAKLTVVGNISSDSILYASGGNSNQWNSACLNQTAYLPLSGGTMSGKLNLLPSTSASSSLNLGSGAIPATTIAGDVFSSGNNIFFKGTTGGPYIFAYKNDTNTFLVPQIISTVSPTGDSAPALRITQAGTGNALVVEDSTNPDGNPFIVNTAGSVGIGLSSVTDIDAKLTVVGNISSTAVIYASGGDSNQWNSAYSTVQTNSATNWNFFNQSVFKTKYEALENFMGGSTASGAGNMVAINTGGSIASSSSFYSDTNGTSLFTTGSALALNQHTGFGVNVVNHQICFGVAGNKRFYSRLAHLELPDSTTNGRFNTGFINAFVPNPTNGAYFSLLDNGNLSAICVAGGTSTAVDLNFRPTLSAMHIYDVHVYSQGLSAQFYYDGALQATIATNIPTLSSQRTNYGISLLRSNNIGNFLRMDVDQIYIRLDNPIDYQLNFSPW